MYARILLISNDGIFSKDLLKSLEQFSEAEFRITLLFDSVYETNEDFNNYDLILVHFSSALNLPIVKDIRIKSEFIPLILLSNETQSSVIIDIMKLGVKDLILKNDNTFDILPHRVKMCVEESRVQKILAKRLRDKEETDVRLDTLNKTLATISHYINNSTTAISGYAQLCKMFPDNGDVKDQFVDLSLKESEKISIVIEEFERAIRNKKEFTTTGYVGMQNTIFDMSENIRKRYKLRNSNELR